MESFRSVRFKAFTHSISKSPVYSLTHHSHAHTHTIMQTYLTLAKIIDLGSFISKRRTPKVKKQYETIGGNSDSKVDGVSGRGMCKILDKACPESAPHKAYTAFRYADPLTEEALEEMKRTVWSTRSRSRSFLSGRALHPDRA